MLHEIASACNSRWNMKNRIFLNINNSQIMTVIKSVFNLSGDGSIVCITIHNVWKILEEVSWDVVDDNSKVVRE